MWLLFVNGLIYVAFIYLHGEWRDLVPRRGDPRDMWEMVKFYLFARRDHPHQGKHNALQKTTYFAMPILGALAVLTGIAIWKPVQLAPLAHPAMRQKVFLAQRHQLAIGFFMFQLFVEKIP